MKLEKKFNFWRRQPDNNFVAERVKMSNCVEIEEEMVEEIIRRYQTVKTNAKNW
jgi:hypothetical protein